MALSGENTIQEALPLSEEQEQNVSVIMVDDAPERSPSLMSFRRKAAAVAMLATSALTACGHDARLTSSDKPITAPTQTEKNDTVVAQPVETTPPTTESSLTSYGNIRTTETLPGDSFIYATRNNGEVVKVAKLRSARDPRAFAESAMGLFACYLSTGSQECLDNLSTYPPFQEEFSKYRKKYFLDELDKIQPTTKNNFQISIYDEKTDPVVFTYSNSGRPNINMAKGTAYAQLSDDPEWQGVNSSAPWYGQILANFHIFFNDTDIDHPKIEYIDVMFVDRPHA